MSLICFLGIFIGSYSLALVTAIMRGFEVTVHEKIQGVHAHIIIDAYGKPINFKALSSVLKNEFPEICSFSPHTERNALIRPYNADNETPTVVIIKSINPELEKNTSALFTKIMQPIDTNNTQLLTTTHIMVGKQYAASNNLVVGDEVEILFGDEENIRGSTVTFHSQKAYIGGIFNTGVDEFDSNVIYCSSGFLKNIFPQTSVEQVHIKLYNIQHESEIITKLHTRLGLSVYSWKDLYPSLVATLKLEKYVSFFVLTLILLIASMNIVSLMHMYITQKRYDIAILKTLGMTNGAISAIFFTIGTMLSLAACLCGLIAAVLTSSFLHRYPFISLPDTYYTTHLPILMETQIIGAVFVLVVLFSLCAIFYSTRQIKRINVSEVLRFE